MYLRFQGQRLNDRSDSKLGIFQLAIELRDEGELPDYIEEQLLKHLEWLKMHLKTPTILREDGHHRAISWFHPRAKEPIKRVREMQAILEANGYYIEQVTTRNPGVIIYEDGYQVVAKPIRKST